MIKSALLRHLIYIRKDEHYDSEIITAASNDKDKPIVIRKPIAIQDLVKMIRERFQIHNHNFCINFCKRQYISVDYLFRDWTSLNYHLMAN
jgi:hypothetical protein